MLEDRKDLLVVAGLGSTAWDITAAGDSPLSFPLWGAMGQAAMIGLGLALAQPKRRVLVITGDGEMLMGLGSLATIGVQQPANLTRRGDRQRALRRDRHAGTRTPRTASTSPRVARACGFNVVIVRSDLRSGTRSTSSPGPHFAAVKVDAEKIPLVLPPREGALLKARFRRALLGPKRDAEYRCLADVLPEELQRALARLLGRRARCRSRAGRS